MKCPFCTTFVALDKSSLKKHLWADHWGRKLIQCEQCSFSTHCNAALAIHISCKHEGSNRFKCPHDDCAKSYYAKSDLVQHDLSVHKKSKPFACESCKFKTSCQRSLRQHSKRKHSSERPFKCFCEKGFIFKSFLLSHWKRVHDGLTMKFQLVNGCTVAVAE